MNNPAIISNEYKDKIIERISNNLNFVMQQTGISQEKLIKKIRKKRGINISQPYMSKILTGNIQSFPGLPLVAICEALDVNIQEIFWENMDKSFLLKKSESEDSKLIYISKNNEFDKYEGTYFCYFFPTISGETDKKVLHGELILSVDPNTKECLASFILHINSQDIDNKEYNGRMIFSPSYNCCYCYLVNEQYGEINFLMFQGLSSNSRKLSCRMVEILTPSAGGTRDATSHRMFISRKELSEKGISVVTPHLKMNSSEIIITREDLEEVFFNLNVPDEFKQAINAIIKPKAFSILREEHFWGFTKQDMDGYDKYKFITELRKKSHANNYCKVGKKVDDILYNYIYKSDDNESFFI